MSMVEDLIATADAQVRRIERIAGLCDNIDMIMQEVEGVQAETWGDESANDHVQNMAIAIRLMRHSLSELTAPIHTFEREAELYAQSL